MPAAGSFDTSRHLMESAARLSVKNRVFERLLCLFGSEAGLDRLHADLLDIAMEAVPCEASSYFARNVRGELVITAARGRVSDQLVGLKLRKGQGLAGACAQDARVISVSDVTRDPRHAAQVAKALGFETRSILAAPVVHDGRVFGVIEIINKTGGDEFPRHEVELVERVGRSAGDLLALRDGRKGDRRR
jgi:Nif-specific regulatory protein